MLETIREYAGERLDEDWDGDATRRRHAEHFLELAEASEGEITAEDHSGLDRLDREHDNIQAAFRWTLENGEAERGMVAAASIWRFWMFRGHLEVGRVWLERLLAVPGHRKAVRARAHGAAGSVAYWQQNVPEAERQYAEALDIYRAIGDRAGIARALYDMAYLPYMRGRDWEETIGRLREAAELFDEVGDEENADKASGDIPYFMMLGGDAESALPLLEQVLARARQKGDVFYLTDHLMRVAEAQLLLGHADEARARLLEGLDIVERGAIPGAIAAFLQSLASTESARGRHELAMRLYGAGQAIHEETGGGGDAHPWVIEDPVAKAREAVGDEATGRALAEGRAMTREEAVAYARTAAPD